MAVPRVSQTFYLGAERRGFIPGFTEYLKGESGFFSKMWKALLISG
jgi:hypothetical protein